MMCLILSNRLSNSMWSCDVSCSFLQSSPIPRISSHPLDSIQHYDRLNSQRVSLESVSWPHIRNVDSHLHFCHNEEVDNLDSGHWVLLPLALRDFLDPCDMLLRVCIIFMCWVLPQLLRRSVRLAITIFLDIETMMMPLLISFYIDSFTVHWLPTSLQFIVPTFTPNYGIAAWWP